MRVPRAGRSALLLGLAWLGSAGAQPAPEELTEDRTLEGSGAFQPRIAVSETYASNVELAGRGSEEHDWISEFTPGFSLVRSGSRLDYSIDYDLQSLIYSEDSDRNDSYHTLWAESTTTLLEERVFFDLEGRYGQRSIDPADRQAASNLYDTNNRTDVAALFASPWYQQRFGDAAEATLRYTFARTDYRNTDETDSDFVEVEDSDSQRIDASLGSIRRDGWTWRTDYLYNKVSFDEAETYKYQRTGAEIGFPFTSRTHFLVAAGVENDPQQNRDDESMDESWWTVGIRAEPTSRQSFEVRTGDRYYGESYELHWRREGSRLLLAVDYSEEPSTSALLEFDASTVTQTGVYGFDRIDTDVFLRKYLIGSVNWATSKSEWAVTFYRDARDYNEGQPDEGLPRDDEEILGLTARWLWQAGARTALETDVRWESQDLEEGDGDQGWFSFSIIRDISPHLEARLEGRRLIRNTESDIADYRDNSGLIGLRWYL